MLSEVSVRCRRTFTRGTAQQWDDWLTRQERAVYEPLLSEPFVLGIDNTVKPIYGHHEGTGGGIQPENILRRPTKKKQTLKALPEKRGTEFAFIEQVEDGSLYENTV